MLKPNIKYLIISLGALFFFGNAFDLSAQATPSLLPLPKKVVLGSGELALNHGLHVKFEGYQEPRLERAKLRFLNIFSKETGIPVSPIPRINIPDLVVKTGAASNPVQQLGEDESYHLEVSSAGATLSAPNPLGVLHGLQTFLQLVHSTPQGFSINSITVDDAPRFPWRGLMIDTGRHFMPLEVIRENLDGMEAVKMNVFHWHLSEDQGFRIESKTYPLLQGKGSDGLYYTQDQVRDIINYARDRGIRVIPEFDMPGHATSWFVGYPELASGKGPYEIERHWGVFDPAMDPTQESTYAFLDKFIDEMASLFPDAYFHIGGDECNGKEWDANPRIQQYMQLHHLKNNAELQAYFTGRVQKLVTKHHKNTIGWDEVLQPDTPHDVVIQSWRGPDSLATAARQGYRGLLSAGYYIDLNQSAEEHYAVDPLGGKAANLTNDQAANILGGEATMWSEYATQENINNKIWPRTAAIAERFWSERNINDPTSMYDRMYALADRLPYYGLSYRASSEQMLLRLNNDQDALAWKVLASAVQPPRDYAREALRAYSAFTPLNRLVDVVPPESKVAHEFNLMVRHIAKGDASEEDRKRVRSLLLQWQTNDEVLHQQFNKSEMTEELTGVSQHISEVAAIGLSSLDHIEEKSGIKAEEKKQRIDSLQKFKAPEAVLLDAILPGVEVLVNAVSTL